MPMDPRDGASRPIAQYTELDIDYDQQSATVGDCRSHFTRLPSPPGGAVNNRPTAVAVYK